MNADSPQAASSIVPREFIGMARDVRRRFATAAGQAGPAMRKIAQAAFAHYDRRRGGGFRPEFLIDAERRWRAITTSGRLDLTVAADKKKHGLVIVDTRVTASETGRAGWDENEVSFSLIRNRLDLAKDHARASETTLSMLSLHTVGRWYQRAFDRDDAALIRDLGLLAGAPDDLINRRGAEFEIDTMNSGRWRGAVVDTLDSHGLLRPCLHVRTCY